MKCRYCAAFLNHNFLDLGIAPPSNAYVNAENLQNFEKKYPLRVMVCSNCWLVQTEDYPRANELFSSDYAYFSSTSNSWMDHARSYCAKMCDLLCLGPHSQVVEVASNDGYLLRNFVKYGVPCLGIEPTASTADAAELLGVPVLREFFGEALAKRLVADNVSADLIVGNNVYAHVPDVNDFTRGLVALLKPEGVVTLEFPHLMRLIELNQFDTVYHEHFSYFSLGVVIRIFAAAGLRVWDVEELSTHGGSLRVFGSHINSSHVTTYRVAELLEREYASGLTQLATYSRFQVRADKVKNDLVAWLQKQKHAGRLVVAYGAAAKGSTLLNYAGIKADLLPFVFDAAISKQWKYMPGSHIPIYPPSELVKYKPDFILILPWNIAAEVQQQNGNLKKQGVRFVTAVPTLTIQ